MLEHYMPMLAGDAAEDVSTTPAGAVVVTLVMTPARTSDTMSTRTFVHDPQATLDYSIDWSDWLPTDDIIESSEWDVGEMDADEVAFSDVATGVVVSGGTLGNLVELVNTVTTEGGKVDDRTILLRIQDR